MCVHVCACGSQKKVMGVFLNHSLSFFFFKFSYFETVTRLARELQEVLTFLALGLKEYK